MDFTEANGTPLEYEKYKEYYIESKYLGQWLFKFENNYGASVIKHFGSYGYEDDLFELAVLYFDEDDIYHLSYNTPITNDVIGYLSNDNVMDYLEKIKKLGD
jgi:hypothetical protein